MDNNCKRNVSWLIIIQRQCRGFLLNFESRLKVHRCCSTNAVVLSLDEAAVKWCRHGVISRWKICSGFAHIIVNNGCMCSPLLLQSCSMCYGYVKFTKPKIPRIFVSQLRNMAFCWLLVACACVRIRQWHAAPLSVFESRLHVTLRVQLMHVEWAFQMPSSWDSSQFSSPQFSILFINFPGVLNVVFVWNTWRLFHQDSCFIELRSMLRHVSLAMINRPFQCGYDSSGY